MMPSSVWLTPLHQLVPAALEQFGVGALVQFAVGRPLDQDVGLLQQVVHHLDRVVEVALDDVVLALVHGGDRRGNDALGDLVDVIGRDVQRIDDVDHGFVDAFHQLLPAALEQVGVGALVQFAVRRPLDQDVGLRQQVVHHLDRAVEVELDDVVLALVFGNDRWRDDALGDLVDVVGGDVQRVDDVGHGLVDALHQLFPAALEQVGVGALVQFAVGRPLDQDVGLRQAGRSSS